MIRSAHRRPAKRIITGELTGTPAGKKKRVITMTISKIREDRKRIIGSNSLTDQRLDMPPLTPRGVRRLPFFNETCKTLKYSRMLISPKTYPPGDICMVRLERRRMHRSMRPHRQTGDQNKKPNYNTIPSRSHSSAKVERNTLRSGYYSSPSSYPEYTCGSGYNALNCSVVAPSSSSTSL